MTTKNGSIGKTREIVDFSSSSSGWVFGMILTLGLVNLICCTPVYLIVIGYLYAKAMGE